MPLKQEFDGKRSGGWTAWLPGNVNWDDIGGAKWFWRNGKSIAIGVTRAGQGRCLSGQNRGCVVANEAKVIRFVGSVPRSRERNV